MRWQGLVWTTPLAAGMLALLELTRVPIEAHRGEPGRVLAALGQLARSALSELALPSLLLFGAAGMVWATRRAEGTRARRAGLAALVGLGLVQASLAREVLIEHPPFAWSWPATLALALVGLGLGALFAWLATEGPERRSGVTLAVSLLVITASLALARGHYLLFVGLYPTWHACVLQLAFVGLATGLALLAALPRVGQGAIPRRAALAVAAPLALVASLELPATAWARPYVVAYTELGRSAGVARALEREAAHLAPRELPGPRTDPMLGPDPRGQARFAARSGLPALPPSFDLGDHDVLLVLADATRHDRTSLARGAEGPTPSLLALAEHAVVLERAYSPSNGTFPSLASMLAMTPVSFAELDVRPRFWRGRLREERETAVEAMRRAGRATFWVGHDHQGCFSDHIAGLEQGFDTRELVPQRTGRDLDADARIATLAIDAIRAHRAAGRRYFGLVFFGSPHDDYQVHDPDRPSATELDRYDQELAFMDAQLGRIVRALEAEGALDRTVIVFAGDHGEAFGEHEHRFHLSSLHDEQIHVPLLVRIGGLAPARLAEPTSTSYVLPWLLARGAPEEREAAHAVLRDDIGPLMRALDGAVLSEMIGPRTQQAALVFRDHVVIYDLLSDLLRIYDAEGDPEQLHDLREDRPDLLGHFVPLARRYRRARYSGRRFRFVDPRP